MSGFEVLFLLVLGHFVADYPLQSDWMAKAKSRWNEAGQTMWPWVLTAHASTHAAAVYLVLGSPLLAVAELIAHWLIDYGKCGNRYGIHVDQALHLLCKVVWVLIWMAT